MREESERIRIIDDNTPFGVREAYRLIRANLQFICNHEGCKVICITSSVAHEGKSTISYNLSSVIAEGGSKVLMIDADMRASNIQESLGLRTRYGLSDILAGKLGLESYSEAIKEMDDKGMLNVMVCGKYPPNPSELLASTRMKDLLDRLKKEYDVIIIDGTPLCMVSDILSLSPIIDGYVLVARAEMTNKKVLANSISMIKNIKGKVLGVILARKKVKGGKKYGYGGYGSYGSYGSYGKN